MSLHNFKSILFIGLLAACNADEITKDAPPPDFGLTTKSGFMPLAACRGADALRDGRDRAEDRRAGAGRLRPDDAAHAHWPPAVAGRNCTPT